MPIRINLLAEQQAAEELRRRDPVKRAMWVCGLIVGAVAVWSGYLQVKLMAAMREVNQYESQWRKIEPDYQKVSSNLTRMAEADHKWASLQSLATNRFLWGPQLNAIQYVMLSVEDVQITRLKTEQAYVVTEAVKPTTNQTGSIVHGRPGSAREKIVLTLDGKDSSKRPGDQVPRLQDAFINYPFFKTNLQKTEMTHRSPPQGGEAGTRPFVTFSIDCLYPERMR